MDHDQPQIPPRPRFRTGFLQRLTAVLIVVIVVFQIAVVVALPWAIRRETLWGQEIARLRAKVAADALRRQLSDYLVSEDADLVAGEFLRAEVQRIDRYLREHQEQLSAEDANEIHDDLIFLTGLLDRLQRRQMGAEPVILDVTPTLNRLLKEPAGP